MQTINAMEVFKKKKERNLTSKVACHSFTHLSIQGIMIDTKPHTSHQARHDEQARHYFSHHGVYSLGRDTSRKSSHKQRDHYKVCKCYAKKCKVL